MSSYTELANRALDWLGKANVTNVDTEQSTEATKIKKIYQPVRDQMLQGYPWSWARKIAALAENVTNDRSNIWVKSYVAPGDILKLRYVRPDQEISTSDITPWPYEYAGGNIYSNSSPAYAIYTYRLTDPTKFSPLFEEAYALAIAARVCMPLTKNVKLLGEMINLARQNYTIATTADANEGYNTTDADSSTIASRA